MKNKYQWVAACAVFVLALALWPLVPVRAAVSLSQTNATIAVGGKVTLKLKGAGERPKWLTSNKQVARVGSRGVVTGVKSGTAVITARLGDRDYSCKVVVNQTYWPSVSQISLKKESSVTISFTRDAVVTYKIQDKSICSARWGSWEGNEVPLYITPKKVGVTYITCSNRANSETIRIRVKVTGIPVKVSNLSTETSDGGDFVYGLNTAEVSFRQDRSSKNTVLYMISDEAKIIRTLHAGPVEAGQLITVGWDGKTDQDEVYHGKFRVKVVADGYATRSWKYAMCYSRSPFFAGNGTAERPYEVTNAEELKRISDFNSRHFVQTGDIDLRAEIMDSLFDPENPFQGTYSGGASGQYHLLNYNGNASLFGVIGTEGVVEHVSLIRASVNGSSREQVAILAECNQGLLYQCAVEQALIHSNTYTDAAVIAAENLGIINMCTASGMIYTYGSMGGIVVRNSQRIAQAEAAVHLNLSVDTAVSAEKVVAVGGIAAVNEGQMAVLDDCKSDGSTLYASGVLPQSAKLYMGGMVGRNLGQVLDGSFLGTFPLSNTSSLSGAVYGGIVAGENSGFMSGTECYAAPGRTASAISNGWEYVTVLQRE